MYIIAGSSLCCNYRPVSVPSQNVEYQNTSVEQVDTVVYDTVTDTTRDTNVSLTNNPAYGNLSLTNNPAYGPVVIT